MTRLPLGIIAGTGFYDLGALQDTSDETVTTAFGDARVSLRLEPRGDGCEVSMHEVPISGPGKWLYNPVADAFATRRNVESLARLAALAERQRPTDTSDR